MTHLRLLRYSWVALTILAVSSIHAQRVGRWEPITPFPDTLADTYEISSAGPGQYVMLTREPGIITTHGIWISNDTANTWRLVRRDSTLYENRSFELATPTRERIIVVGIDADSMLFVDATSDAGITWKRSPIGRHMYDVGLNTRGALHAVFLAIPISDRRQPDSVNIVSTSDGGFTWNRRAIDYKSKGERPYEVLRLSPSTMLLTTYDTVPFGDVPTKWHLYRSHDDGGSWIPLAPPGFAVPRMRFADSNVGIAFGGDYVGSGYERRMSIARTTDGGASWTTVYDTLRRYTWGFFDASLADRDHWVFTTSANDMLRTTDGGTTWTIERYPWHWQPYPPNAVAYASPDQAIVALRQGLMLRYTGRTSLASPEFTLPDRNLGNLPLDVTYAWTRIEGAISYDFQLADTLRDIQLYVFDPHVFDALYLDRQGLIDTSDRVRLQSNKRYVARVRANGGGGDTSDWRVMDVFTQVQASAIDPLDIANDLVVHPNPSGRNGWQVDLSLDRAANIRMTVVDLSGRELRLVIDERLGAGLHRVRVESGDLAAGAYVLVVREGNLVRSRLLFK